MFMGFSYGIFVNGILYPMTDPCIYIYMVTWIPSIYPLYVSIEKPAPAGSVMAMALKPDSYQALMIPTTKAIDTLAVEGLTHSR